MRATGKTATAMGFAALTSLTPFTRAADIDGPRGIYVLGTLNSAQLANIRTGPAYDFVDGYTLRVKWSDLQTGASTYNFALIDQAIAALQPAGQRLTLEVFPSYVPPAVMAGVTQTFVDSRGATQPVPWDPAASGAWAAFNQALAAHTVFDAISHAAVPLSAHPTLSMVDAPIVGQQAYRDLTNNLVNHPGYSRATYVSSVLQSVHASRDAFPGKFGFFAAFSMDDADKAHPLDFAVRDALLADFNSAGKPSLGFFAENLADATPKSGIPLTRILDTTKDVTYTPLQALTSWTAPFANPPAVASGNPATGISYAYSTWGTTYFELYVNDIDAAVAGATDAAGRPLLPDLEYWHTFLTSVPEPSLPICLVPLAIAIAGRRRLRHAWTALLPAALLVPASGALATTQSVTLFSPSNNRNLSFTIYLPPTYATDTARHYPIVYSLHGIGGTAPNRANQVVPTLDAAIVAGTVAPMIYVFPDGQTDSFYGDSVDNHKRVHSNIIDEVLPYVDAHYRTLADRDHRAVEGFSMGGFGAGLYAAKHTDLFSAIVEYGGALSTWQNLVTFNPSVAADMYQNAQANFLPYSLWDVTDANAAAVRTTVAYKMIVGDADPQYQSNTRWRDHLLSLNIDPHFQVLPGVAHDGTAYYAEGSGLRFLADHFATVPEPAAFAVPALLLPLLGRHRRLPTAASCRAQPPF